MGTKGYAYIMRPDHPRAMKSGYVKRADLVAEEMLGRPLRTDEVVHHKNHIRLDDSPENLLVLTEKEHMRLHGEERREAAALRNPPKPKRKRIAWPPREELEAMLSTSSYREIGERLGCSHVAVYKHLLRTKKQGG